MTDPQTHGPSAANRSQNSLKDLIWLWVTLTALSIATMHAVTVMDADIWWHLKTGQWILNHAAVPTRDVFSAHAGGQPWIEYTWLFDVLVYKLFSAWQYQAMLGLTTFLSLAYTAWIVVFLARFVNLRRALILATAAYLPLIPLKSPRPWLFTIVFFSIELTLLWIARERNRPAWLLPIVPLLALWANVHIQFVYGLGLIGLFALDQSLPAAVRTFLRAEPASQLRGLWLWLLLAGSFLATLVNPYGWNLYRLIFEDARLSPATMNLIQELQPNSFRFLSDWMILLLACSAIFALGCAKEKNLLLISLLAAGCYFGFRSQRDTWFMMIVAVLTLAYTARSFHWAAPNHRSLTIGIAIPLSIVSTFAFLVRSSQYSNISLGQAVTRTCPDKASAFIEAHQLPGPLFNSYNWGGYLIWRLPELKVSIDGRANLYLATLANSANTLGGDKDWEKDPDLKKARTILLEQHSALTSLLRESPNYRLLYEDEIATVFEPVK